MITSPLALHPSLLTNPTPAQLEEIYSLRVTAWATNPLFDISRFPKGLFDAFDECSHHWVVGDEGRFVAAARVTIRSQLSELPDYTAFSHIQLPIVSSVAMLSRLVVHPDFRGTGLAQMMDDQRIDFWNPATFLSRWLTQHHNGRSN